MDPKVVVGQMLYRYVRPLSEYADAPRLVECRVTRLTPCGCWVQPCGGRWATDNREHLVLLHTRKKYACLTREDALNSFIRRTERSILILKGQLDGAKDALQGALRLRDSAALPDAEIEELFA